MIVDLEPQDGVGPLLKGGQLEVLEGADGDAGRGRERRG